MHCPSCGAQTKVIESRQAEGGAVVRRRRECRECGRRLTSFERRERDPAWVLKRDGERQPFDRAKLRKALGRAAHKRPVPPQELDALVERIEVEAELAGGELAATRIGELSLAGLRRLDLGAYLQFAGVDFSDPKSIRAELGRLDRESKNNPANRGTKAGVRPTRGAGSTPPNRRQTRGEI